MNTAIKHKLLVATLIAPALFLSATAFASEVTGTLSAGSSTSGGSSGSITGTVVGGTTSGGGGGGGGTTTNYGSHGGAGGGATNSTTSTSAGGGSTVLTAPATPLFAATGVSGTVSQPSVHHYYPSVQSSTTVGQAPQDLAYASGFPAPAPDQQVTNSTLAATASQGMPMGARIAWILFFIALAAYLVYAGVRAYRRTRGVR